jgi:hypothetical protein
LKILSGVAHGIPRRLPPLELLDDRALDVADARLVALVKTSIV